MFRTLTLILLTFSTIISHLNAQGDARAEEVAMIRGVNTAIVKTFPTADDRFLENEWKDFMGKYGKVEKVRKTNQQMVQSANLVNYPNIKNVTVYNEVFPKDSTADFAIWVEADTTFVTPDDTPEAWKSVESMMADFAYKVRLDMLNIELDEQQKELDKLNNKMTKLTSDHQRYVETIDRAHEDIRQAEADIVENQTEQEAVTAQMDSYKGMDSDDDAAKQLKKLEKQMRKLMKRNVNYHNDIASNKDRIESAEQDIVDNEAEQETTREILAKQEAVVEEIRARLDKARSEKPE